MITRPHLVLPLCAKIYILARHCPKVAGALSVRNLFIAQTVLVLITACIWGALKSEAILPVLYGGAACIFPTFLFARFFLSQKHKRRPGQILIIFYVGEFVKMFVSALIMIAAIRYLHALAIPLVAGFLVGNLVFWLAPTLVLKQQMRST